MHNIPCILGFGGVLVSCICILLHADDTEILMAMMNMITTRGGPMIVYMVRYRVSIVWHVSPTDPFAADEGVVCRSKIVSSCGVF
jgi:hypothetical protein